MKFVFCKKQVLYIGLAAISLGLAVGTHVFAQEASPTDHATTTAKEHVQDHKGALSLRIQNRITNLARNMHNRMNAAMDRLDQIITRMESRIQKLNAQGVDTAEAEEMLGHARDELAESRKSLSDIDVLVEDAITSDNPKQSFKDVKSAFLIAAQSIRDTQTHLRTTLALLKEAVASSDLGRGVSDAVSNRPDSAKNGGNENDASTTDE